MLPMMIVLQRSLGTRYAFGLWAGLLMLCCMTAGELTAQEPRDGEDLSVEELVQADPVTYSRDIQPLLAKHCVLCHGPDDDSAGLRLDQFERATGELDSGSRAIVPGQPGESGLLARVTATDDAVRMPPEGDPLSAEEVALLRDWIASGAKFERHWAYRPITKPTVPQVKNNTWPRNAIDHFVLARLEQVGVSPAPEVEPALLVKRLYYDLIGLPPTPAEVDAFLADSSEAAYAALVDQLLASPHFGERWGRHWLDMARYADSDGYEKDRPRPDAWRYRDWVIEAINRDMPFDQFTIEQLAGDLLPEATPEQKLATAFHRQTLTNTEGGTDQEEFRVEATFDRTETTGAVWLGLTLTCARCHTHKYDQITQTEYYQLYSFFNNANEANTEIARTEAAMEQYRQDKAHHDQRVAKLRQQYQTAREKLQPEINAWTRDMTARWSTRVEADSQNAPPYEPEQIVLQPRQAEAAGKAKLTIRDDHSILASGTLADKETYTLTFELPEDFPASEFSGLVLETLTDESLPAQGPGRAANGNFVLTQVKLLGSDHEAFKQPVSFPLVNAEAEHAQQKLSALGALSTEEKSGWAISPKFGAPHTWRGFLAQPVSKEGVRFLRVVLDHQYGGKHVLGAFRLALITSHDPFRALPPEVLQALQVAEEKRSAEQRELIADHVASLHDETRQLGQQLQALIDREPRPPLMTVRVMAPAQRETKLLQRGDFLQPGDLVSAGDLDVIRDVHPLTSRHAESPPDRLDLARWLVDPGQPLTPRVTVNHAWTYLFGRGIVPSVNDFGVRGEQPTHPELLEWLAWNFPRDLGWSRKELIRLIVMSSTYRQDSRHRPDLQELDPTNRLLARQNRLRVSAEVVRDLHLSVSGLLSSKIGGPSVFPPLPPGVAELSYANNFKWATSTGEDAYRRGMYTFFKRTAPHPTLISFDCPDSNTTSLIREISNTPLQALVTLNNVVFAEAAQAMARRVLTDLPEAEDRQRLTHALRICIARYPDSEEVEQFVELLELTRAHYRQHPEQAEALTKQHAVPDLPREENAAWIATVRMMMNLDELIVRD